MVRRSRLAALAVLAIDASGAHEQVDVARRAVAQVAVHALTAKVVWLQLNAWVLGAVGLAMANNRFSWDLLWQAGREHGLVAARGGIAHCHSALAEVSSIPCPRTPRQARYGHFLAARRLGVRVLVFSLGDAYRAGGRKRRAASRCAPTAPRRNGRPTRLRPRPDRRVAAATR